MTQIGKIVSKNNLQLEYFTFGFGSKTVICFHGHGKSAMDFNFLSSENLKIITINLFFHGASIFPKERIENEPIKELEFIELFKQILSKENVKQFHILAFSQGGRFALCLTPHFGPRIQSLTLLAPDGMDNFSFYNWSSRQLLARKLFLHLEKKPKRSQYISKYATKLRLMRPKVKQFVDEFTSNEVAFQRASATWRAFRMLQTNYLAVSTTVKKYSIPFLIIMGTYDQVIRPKQAYKFAKKLQLENCVIEIENGHDFFKESAINKFKHLLPFIEH